jgi:Domain of unknown function (DUF222)
MVDIDLATCAAGPRLATLLDRLDVAQLDAEQVLAYVSAVRRQQAWTDAQLIRATARFATARRRTGPTGAAGAESLVSFGGAGSPLCGARTPEELGPDLRMSRRCAHRLLADSLDLTHRLADVWVALRLGLIDTWRARVVAEETRQLSAETAGAVGKQVLGRINRLDRGEIHRTIDRIVTGSEPDPPQDTAARQ